MKQVLQLESTGSFALGEASGAGIADADGDGQTEIVITIGITLVFDAVTGDLEWSTDGVGWWGKVLFGNVDDDSDIETIVGGPMMIRVLNVRTQTEELSIDYGDNMDFDIGDTDADGKDEVVVLQDWYIAIVHADTGEGETGAWEKIGAYNKIVVENSDDTPEEEIIVANARLQRLQAFNSLDTILWEVDYPDELYHYVGGLTSGDIEQDGKKEIVWTLRGTNNRLIVSKLPTDPTFLVLDKPFDPPYFSFIEDLEGDGNSELIVVNELYNTGTWATAYMTIYDPLTRHVEWEGNVRQDLSFVREVEVRQFDNDPALEILIVGKTYEDWNHQVFVMYDGVTKEEEWSKTGVLYYDTQYQPRIDFGDVDADGNLEIAFIYGYGSSTIDVLDPETNTVLWHHVFVNKSVSALALRDINGDSSTDLVLLFYDDNSNERIVVYDTLNYTPQYTITLPMMDGASTLFLTNRDQQGAGEIWLFRGIYATPKIQLSVYSGTDGYPLWELQLPVGYKSIVAADIDYDGREEVMISIPKQERPFSSVLIVEPTDTGYVEEHQFNENWEGEIDFGDIDGDGIHELVFGGNKGVSLIRLFAPGTVPTPTTTPSVTPTATETPVQRTLYLPLVERYH